MTRGRACSIPSFVNVRGAEQPVFGHSGGMCQGRSPGTFLEAVIVPEKLSEAALDTEERTVLQA